MQMEHHIERSNSIIRELLIHDILPSLFSMRCNSQQIRVNAEREQKFVTELAAASLQKTVMMLMNNENDGFFCESDKSYDDADEKDMIEKENAASSINKSELQWIPKNTNSISLLLQDFKNFQLSTFVTTPFSILLALELSNHALTRGCMQSLECVLKAPHWKKILASTQLETESSSQGVCEKSDSAESNNALENAPVKYTLKIIRLAWANNPLHIPASLLPKNQNDTGDISDDRHITLNHDVEALCRMLIWTPSSPFASLADLDLRGTGLQQRDCFAILSALRGHRTLKRLDMSSTTLGRVHFGVLGAQALADFLQGNHLLLSLKVSGTGLGNTDCMCLIAEALRDNMSLRVLDLCANQISFASCGLLGPALASMFRLTRLCLKDNDFGSAGCIHLAHALPTMDALNYLDIRACGVGPKGFAMISRAVSDMMALECILCDRNSFKQSIHLKNHSRHEDWKHRAQIDKACKLLQVFELRVSPRFHLNSSLRKLSFNGSGLDDALVTDITRSLLLQPTVQKLCLAGNSITNTGAEAIAQLISHSKTLQYITIEMNRIAEAGGAAIASALLKSDSMFFVNFNLNEIGSETAEILYLALSSKAQLHVSCDGNKIPWHYHRKLLILSHHNKKLYDSTVGNRVDKELDDWRCKEISRINAEQENVAEAQQLTELQQTVQWLTDNQTAFEAEQKAQTIEVLKQLQDILDVETDINKKLEEIDQYSVARNMEHKLQSIRRSIEREMKQTQHFAGQLPILLDEISRQKSICLDETTEMKRNLRLELIEASEARQALKNFNQDIHAFIEVLELRNSAGKDARRSEKVVAPGISRPRTRPKSERKTSVPLLSKSSKFNKVSLMTSAKGYDKIRFSKTSASSSKRPSLIRSSNRRRNSSELNFFEANNKSIIKSTMPNLAQNNAPLLKASSSKRASSTQPSDRRRVTSEFNFVESNDNSILVPMVPNVVELEYVKK